ncbi:hypothetical protein [Lentisalinibacter salinarum]|uniref:hypothetical protein n=1 Tax=Lentisalinibacter salinarum TaxID=2992239 RepID=UPI00386DCA6C
MAGDKDSARLEPDEVVSAVYYPNKARLVAATVSGSIAGLIVGIGVAVLLTGDGAGGLLTAAASAVLGAGISLFGSASQARLRFGADWVEGPVEGGVGYVLMWRHDITALEVVDQHKLRLARHDGERLLVDLAHYEFMDQQMIRMRLTSLAGGRTSTPPEALVQESKRHRLGFRRKKEQGHTSDPDRKK